MKAQTIIRSMKTCPSCKTLNLAWRETCIRCNAPFKADGPDVAMWVIRCGRCEYFNAPEEDYCRHCRKPLIKSEGNP